MALDFHGGSDRVERAAEPGMINPAMSVCAWIKVDANGGPEQWIMGMWSELDPTAQSFALWIDPDGTPHAAIVTSGDLAFLGGATPLTPGTWYHIALTYGANAARLFINGTQVASAGCGPAPILTTAPFMIGAIGRNGSPELPFDGKIEDVRIYNAALSGANLTLIKNGLGSDAVAGKVYWWKLNQQPYGDVPAGADSVYSTPAGKEGTPGGSPQWAAGQLTPEDPPATSGMAIGSMRRRRA